MALMKAELADLGAATLMLFLTLVGCPISWHKMFWATEPLKLEAGELHIRKEITSQVLVGGKLTSEPTSTTPLCLGTEVGKLERKCRPLPLFSCPSSTRVLVSLYAFS